MEEIWQTLAALFRAWTGMIVPDTMQATAVRELVRMADHAGSQPMAFLQTLDDDAEARQELLDRIGLGTTWFLREEAGLTALVSRLSQHGSRDEPALVWSVGCSSGEEPYSLAMAMLEAGVNGRILATDLNRRALRHGIDGRYPRRSLARLPAHWRARYFEDAGPGTARVTDAVRRCVSFELHNLRTEHTLPSGWHRFDAIVCRNVLIYFDRDEAVEIVERLAARCRPGGYLLLSAVERPLFWMSNVVVDRDTAELVQVSRRTSSPSIRVSVPVHEPGTSDAAASPGSPGERELQSRPRTAEPATHAEPDDVRRASRPIGLMATGATGRASAPGEPARPNHVNHAPPVDHLDDLERLDGPADLVGLIGRAGVAEQAGRLDEALALIDSAVARAPLAAAAHLARGLLLKRAARVPEAIDAFRAARFLDAHAWLAPYQLALCLEATGEHTEAEEAYRHALGVIEAGGPPGLASPSAAIEALATTVAEVCRNRVGSRDP
jgi:chemotaxis protein methyltransferase CheR